MLEMGEILSELGKHGSSLVFAGRYPSLSMFMGICSVELQWIEVSSGSIVS